MTDIPVMIDGLVQLVPWPWLPPSELHAAIIKLDVTKVKPPAGYWEQMVKDFPLHPAGLLGPDAQVCDIAYNCKGTHDCSNAYIDSVL
jgi:hypothetical protein